MCLYSVDLVKSRLSYISSELIIFLLIGEAIQDSETYMEFVKKSFSIITNTCKKIGEILMKFIKQ